MSETTATEIPGRVAAETGDRGSAAVARSLEWLRRYGPIAALYVAVTVFTDALYMGDTGGYANHILELELSELLQDFGHVLWLFLGWSVWSVLRPFVSGEAHATIIFILVSLTWIAGLASALLIYHLALRVARRAWVAGLVTFAFIFTQGFLNFTQTGCSYVSGLSFFLLGLWLIFREEDKPRHSRAGGIGAGAAFAAAAGLWFPYVLAVPGALVSTLMLFGPSRWRLGFAARASLAMAVFSAALYGSAAALQGIHDLAGLEQWMFASGHGIDHISGFSRMLFGFARSIVNMGKDGIVFKRFLLHDPFNPVPFLDLLRLSLGKFLLFYLFMGIMAAALARVQRGRRFLAFLAVSGLPIVIFAWSWQGGDMERYMPFYPAISLSLAYLLADGPWRGAVRLTVSVWLVATVWINGTAMAKPALQARQEQVVARLRALQPLWKPHSRIAVLNLQDPIYAFVADFPFHPLNRTGILTDGAGHGTVFDIADLGASHTPRWREIFAEQARSAWTAGGDLWVSARVLPSRPGTESDWVEGDDPRLPWGDLNEFFSRLETGASVGGDDGFFLLPPSARNLQLLTR